MARRLGAVSTVFIDERAVLIVSARVHIGTVLVQTSCVGFHWPVAHIHRCSAAFNWVLVTKIKQIQTYFTVKQMSILQNGGCRNLRGILKAGWHGQVKQCIAIANTKSSD